MEEGFDVTFLSDAIGASSIPEYEASIHLNYPMLSNAVIKVDDFLAAINNPTAGSTSVQPGDTVYGSDHGEIGKIDKVVEATEDKEGYLLVASGLIFKTDTYIPFDAVVKRIGTDVFINIPKLVLATMPWTEPATRSDNRQKQGPAASDVEKLYGSYSPSGSSE
jgi:hypothetical protein